MGENTVMEDTDKAEYENILILENMIEADLMSKLLEEEGIPFFIREWHDVSYDGIFVEEKGWGWLMGRKADEEKVRQIYETRTQSDSQTAE